ncbi:hypothetical protein L1887_06382 [Cichorium endivia]|nr:hypothetical protein L1887_06382 [Cichorium endivia]
MVRVEQLMKCDVCKRKRMEDLESLPTAELEHLNTEESRLDEWIRETKERLNSMEFDQNSRKHLFLRGEDFRNLPCFENQTLIAIRAPRGSCIEVPDPDQSYSPIDLYLISEFEEQRKSCNETAQEGCSHVSNSTNSSQQKHLDPVNSVDSQSYEIHKIIPPQNDIADDYWFGPNSEVSATDLWGPNLP